MTIKEKENATNNRANAQVCVSSIERTISTIENNTKSKSVKSTCQIVKMTLNDLRKEIMESSIEDWNVKQRQT